jgi:hypothetical protein
MANHILERQRQAEEKTALMSYFHTVQSSSAFIRDCLTGDELDTGGLQTSFVSSSKPDAGASSPTKEALVIQDALSFVETNFLKASVQVAPAEPTSTEDGVLPLSQPVVIKGPAACGKSVFLKQYLHKHTQAHLARDARCLVPVYVPVYELAMLLIENPDPTVDHLKSVLERLFQEDEHSSLLIRLLLAMRDQKRLVVLLDGLDEGEGAGAHLEAVSTSAALMEYICDRLVSEVHLCITSREQCVAHPLTTSLLRSAGFMQATMSPLSEQQRQALVGHRLACFKNSVGVQSPSGSSFASAASSSLSTASVTGKQSPTKQAGINGTKGGGWVGMATPSLGICTRTNGPASAGGALASRSVSVHYAAAIEAVDGFNYHMETPLFSTIAEEMEHNSDSDGTNSGQSLLLLNLLIAEYQRTQVQDANPAKGRKKSTSGDEETEAAEDEDEDVTEDKVEIGFEGGVVPGRKEFVASFPGVHGSDWERMAHVLGHKSVACVFAPSWSPLFGEHVLDPNPEISELIELEEKDAQEEKEEKEEKEEEVVEAKAKTRGTGRATTIQEYSEMKKAERNAKKRARHTHIDKTKKGTAKKAPSARHLAPTKCYCESFLYDHAEPWVKHHLEMIVSAADVQVGPLPDQGLFNAVSPKMRNAMRRRSSDAVARGSIPWPPKGKKVEVRLPWPTAPGTGAAVGKERWWVCTVLNTKYSWQQQNYHSFHSPSHSPLHQQHTLGTPPSQSASLTRFRSKDRQHHEQRPSANDAIQSSRGAWGGKQSKPEPTNEIFVKVRYDGIARISGAGDEGAAHGRWPAEQGTEWIKLSSGRINTSGERRTKLRPGQAPFGCAWFGLWANHVHRLAHAGQRPIVVYRRGLMDVPEEGGLGFSQRRELAYLRKLLHVRQAAAKATRRTSVAEEKRNMTPAERNEEQDEGKADAHWIKRMDLSEFEARNPMNKAEASMLAMQKGVDKQWAQIEQHFKQAQEHQSSSGSSGYTADDVFGFLRRLAFALHLQPGQSRAFSEDLLEQDVFGHEVNEEHGHLFDNGENDGGQDAETWIKSHERNEEGDLMSHAQAKLREMAKEAEREEEEKKEAQKQMLERMRQEKVERIEKKRLLKDDKQGVGAWEGEQKELSDWWAKEEKGTPTGNSFKVTRSNTKMGTGPSRKGRKSSFAADNKVRLLTIFKLRARFL